MANKVTLIPQRDMSKHLAKDGKVQAAVRAQAEKMAARGRGILAAHRVSGAHKVEYEGHRSSVKYGHIDHYVVLTGPAPISVEFGHRAENGRWVAGIYVLTRAMFSL